MNFERRHIGPSATEVELMLKTIGEPSLEHLIDKTVPSDIRLHGELNISAAQSEAEFLDHMNELAGKNKPFKNYIGMGYHGTITPTVIRRNIFENPGWYTSYTPYQAEISQGRLEALLNFQTVVSELTGLEIANASLLDEATAAAEAMMMLFNNRSRELVKDGTVGFLVDKNIYPQTLAVLKTRAKALSIRLTIAPYDSTENLSEYFGALVQYPAGDGDIRDYESFTSRCHDSGVRVVCAADIMSLCLLPAPGHWGADVVVGSTQRFGVPMGYGGPHAAFFATKDEYKRNIPGRIIGVSKDRHGDVAYRMALQTREQHIRRDKATSNICTAQALLAVMAGMYAVYHGPDGLKNIAGKIHENTTRLASGLKAAGWTLRHDRFFDTLRVSPQSAISQDELKSKALANNVNLRYFDDSDIGITLDETCTESDLKTLSALLNAEIPEEVSSNLTRREDDILGHEVFNSKHSETLMMRYIKRLENKDISLVHSMIPLGSCTMKLNAATQLEPLSWPEFANVHPFAPLDQVQGYQTLISELEKDLSEITGFAGVSLQPNSGAQGEYAGLMVIKAYHEDKGQGQRDIILIPSSAHGTNPASAVIAGCKVVVVKCDERGNIDVTDLKAKAEKHADQLAGLMITYPSTHGVFESAVRELTSIVHDNGGLVYMDGANMNAQVGLTNPGNIGADVCHLNLHKTFAIPHGGGGPGMGPIGVVEKLLPYLPANPVIKTGGEKAVPAISAAPWGSALILLISYAYIKLLGPAGLRRATEISILNANYLRARLESHFNILYKGDKGMIAHEMILDCRSFKQAAGVQVEDIAKRLIDYGFHAPTVSFPVAGTLMVEPTESESLEELDRFVEAMVSIRGEINDIAEGAQDKEDNTLNMAPHTAIEALADSWTHPYSRKLATYPALYLMEQKYWPPVARIDSAYGDRNLICTCPSVESYEQASGSESEPDPVLADQE